MQYRDHTAHAVQASAELKQRLTKFVRRELRVFDGVDQEFLTGYIVSIASQLELRSDSAVRLLAEFLGEDNAEHFLQYVGDYGQAELRVLTRPQTQQRDIQLFAQSFPRHPTI